MKQILLLFSAVFLAAAGVFAQEAVWEEDFSAGFRGWTVNTSFCETFNEPEYGVWTLTGGTINGEAISLEDGYFRWSFASSSEYSILFGSDINVGSPNVYGTVYARYEMNGDTLTTDTDTMAFNATGDGNLVVTETAGGIVRWASNMELDGESPDITGQMIGLGNPIITFSNAGQNFTYTSQDATVVLEFSKISDCGYLWNWSPNGNIGYGIFGFEAGSSIDSETSDNGVAVINTLYHNSQGDANYNPGGGPYPEYFAELISPAIDISAAAGALSLNMTEYVRLLNEQNDAPNGIISSLAISGDDGATWSDAIDLNPLLASNEIFNGSITIPISNDIIGGADEIRMKFTFAGDFYFWAIDDVALVDRIPYEMQANSNFFAIPTNFITPASQVEDLYWMSDIQNNGGAVAENVILNLTIIDDIGTEIYNEDKPYGDITPDSLAENSFFDLPLSAESQVPGVYAGTYTVSHDSIDSDLSNNALDFEFSVSDTLFAKESGRTRGLAPSGSTSWYIGNSFYLPKGDGWYARYISFMVDNASDVVDNEGAVTIFLFESDGDTNDDGRISGEELGSSGAIAFNEYIFDGTEDEELITMPIDIGGEGIALQDAKHYLLVLQYVGVDEDDQLFLSASEDFDYGSNTFVMDSLMMQRYANVVAIGNEDVSFFRNGFGGGVIPVIKMSIGTNADLDEDPIVSTDDILSDAYKMRVFPNPSNLAFKLQLDMPEQLDVTVRLFDQSGRILLSQDHGNLQQGIFTYDVSKLPAATYWVQLVTAAGTRTEKVIVTH